MKHEGLFSICDASGHLNSRPLRPDLIADSIDKIEYQTGPQPFLVSAAELPPLARSQ